MSHLNPLAFPSPSNFLNPSPVKSPWSRNSKSGITVSEIKVRAALPAPCPAVRIPPCIFCHQQSTRKFPLTAAFRPTNTSQHGWPRQYVLARNAIGRDAACARTTRLRWKLPCGEPGVIIWKIVVSVDGKAGIKGNRLGTRYGSQFVSIMWSLHVWLHLPSSNPKLDVRGFWSV